MLGRDKWGHFRLSPVLVLVCGSVLAQMPPHLFFEVAGSGSGSWPDILASVGFQTGADASIVIVRPDAAGPIENWVRRARAGAVLIVEGASPLASTLGFIASANHVRVESIEDVHRPALRIVWEKALDLPVFHVPKEALVFARERWGGAPLAAGMRLGEGAVLWVAADPGARGYERFPFLLHALRNLGVEPPFQSRRLWAFFDPSYRLRADSEYLAKRWRGAGIAALHVAAWPYFEPDPQRDRYLNDLVAACHRNAILVYAWLELPHVSERFWEEHPEWREKTAALQDAHLDWRKLMNLVNRDCFRAAAGGVHRLIGRFDWDGVNLAELYFESLEGSANPARFTPMNDDVRQEVRANRGFDPLDLFARGKPADAAQMRAFLDYRIALAARLEREWVTELEAARRSKPHLDLVLTHIDDRFDPRMRDALGSDASAALAFAERSRLTFLIEDPATVWHLGPQRYPDIARRYGRKDARLPSFLGLDINIAERYQDVYPTKQQTGTELFQLVRMASAAFPRVALYFEASLLAPDLPLLPSSAAIARAARRGSRLMVDAAQDLRVRWRGPVLVDGQAWPASDGESVLLAPGKHVLSPGARDCPIRLVDFSGDLRGARLDGHGIDFTYRSRGRSFAILDVAPSRVELDGNPQPIDPTSTTLTLPGGQHSVRIRSHGH